jgi:hypothetical protein
MVQYSHITPASLLPHLESYMQPFASSVIWNQDRAFANVFFADKWLYPVINLKIACDLTHLHFFINFHTADTVLENY